MILEATQLGPVYLVFHDASQDVKYLKAIDALPDGFVVALPDSVPNEGTYIVDTSDLFGALEGKVGERRKLDVMCRLLGIKTEYRHNAGNDAHYTLEALMEMASGNQIDAQREVRWPKHTEPAAPGTTASLKVNFEPWEEDSDVDELEGMVLRQVIDGELVEKSFADLDLSDDDFD